MHVYYYIALCLLFKTIWEEPACVATCLMDKDVHIMHVGKL